MKLFIWSIFIIFNACATLQTERTYKNEEGYKLYSKKCSSCHSLLKPGEYTAEKWHESVDKYGTNVKLTNEEKELILDFLKRYSKKNSR